MPRIDWGGGGGDGSGGSCRGHGRGPNCLNFKPPCDDSWLDTHKIDSGGKPDDVEGECSGDWTGGQIVDEVRRDTHRHTLLPHPQRALRLMDPAGDHPEDTQAGGLRGRLAMGRESLRPSVIDAQCVCARARVCVRACVRVCVRACVRAQEPFVVLVLVGAELSVRRWCMQCEETTQVWESCADVMIV